VTTTTPVSMDPRIRERRIEVKREAGRKRLRVLLVAMGAFVFAGVVYLVVESPALDVDHVRVSGTRNLTAQQVIDTAAVPRGAALLRVDTGAVAHRLEALPWVEHAKVSRDVPGTLRITVTEYAPTAYVRIPTGGVALVAPTGHVIARAATPPVGAVEIVGLRRVPALGALVSPPSSAGIVRVLPAALARQVSAVDVGGDGVSLKLARGGDVRLGSLTDLRAKAASALAVLDRVGTQPFVYLDVSMPETPVVGETGSVPHR
jgi:cell division protein FtsQ